MRKLVEGIHQFRKDTFFSKKELFERLSQGQNPEVLFITCSDSRINPNLITHTEPGELFIIRNAGNLVPPHGTTLSGEIATIEYAVSELRVEDIVVCGHTLCGAMNGLLAGTENLSHLPALVSWLNLAATTKKLVEEVYAPQGLSQEDLINIAIQENVLVQLEHLRTLPIVATALTKGELKLHGWVYKIQTGEVFGYDPDLGQFGRISEVSDLNGTVGRPGLSETTSI